MPTTIRRISAVLTAAVVSTATVSVLAAAPAAADESCPATYVVAIPGTWETSLGAAPTNNMLSSVVRRLQANGVAADFVNYPATAFPWEGEIYGKSEQQAVANASGMLRATADRCPGTKFGIIGYSQGADAAGDLAASIGTGNGIVAPDRVVAVGLISDPKRAESDALVGPPVAGAGIGGARPGGFGWLSPVTRTICAVGDLYCSTPRTDFVSRLAGFLAVTSNPTPETVGRATADAGALLNDLFAAGGLPTLLGQVTDQANRDRVKQLQQFYSSQVHTDYNSYGVDQYGTSATSWMAGYILGAR